MHTKELIIIGAGGHAKVVLDALAASKYLIKVWDDNPLKLGSSILGYKIEASKNLESLNSYVHFAIGCCEARERLQLKLSKDASLLTIIHPQALVSSSAEISAGTFIAAFARVAPDAVIEESCIINHGAIVDHDVKIGAYSHIAPNVTLGGAVKIGKRVLIGSSATVLPDLVIGDGCVVGAGSVVTCSLPANTKVKGIPAR